MLDNTERIQSRLKNIQSIEPLVRSLRTISLGAWRIALNKKKYLSNYRLEIKYILRILQETEKSNLSKKEYISQQETIKIKYILIGSERGLCGNFNKQVFNKFIEIKKYEDVKEENIEVTLIGTQLKKVFQAEGQLFHHFYTLANITKSFYQFAHQIIIKVLENKAIVGNSGIFIIYNKYVNSVYYNPTMIQLSPLAKYSETKNYLNPIWPSPIIDSSPEELYEHIQNHLIVINFLACLLESQASEQSSRFQNLDEASHNTQRIINDLQIRALQNKRKEITREVQELALAAGLLNNS